MENSSKRLIKNRYRVISNIFTTIFMIFVFAFIWNKDLNPILYTTFHFKGSFLLICVYGFFMIMFVRTFGGFKINVYNRLNAVVSQIAALMCAAVVQFFFVFIFVGNEHIILTILLSFLKVYAVQLVFCLIYTPIIMTIYHKIFPPYNILLIYGNDRGETIHIERKNHNYVIKDIISCDSDIEKIDYFIDTNDLVLIDEVPEEKRAFILKLCFEKKKKVLFSPTISNIIINSVQHTHILDTPLYVSQDMPFLLQEQVIKRCGDVLLSILGIIILSPIMILTSLAIFLYDRGPVFYRQTRYTLDGKIFKILKFRSMIPNAEENGGARLALENDIRITPVGRFIRACRIDEIPQLFNILIGDMSFVGPRPERPEIADEYTKETPEFAYRLRVKAGLTGFAQVYGKYNTNYIDKLKLDMIYIEKASILLDIQLILLTLKVVFIKDSTEGLEEGEITANKR